MLQTYSTVFVALWKKIIDSPRSAKRLLPQQLVGVENGLLANFVSLAQQSLFVLRQRFGIYRKSDGENANTNASEEDAVDA
ncbi:hypothetical protein WA1_50245 [Scytonema hofmannii PCC 7110]|uniref:Uncharacterized protein n=1 Tax=Scytonema hofmannii PCC 7110 TaxID=128403 RepID=A0A139WR59_9CYAN|nr:hypothetical protein [Scytonema hofmannii]KYC34908.1 hypothetical protein WA1_50245 [Scytonema hofmannii PCC 7110]